MADGTHIEWTDATWNPVTGCSVVSPGCTNCYAMKLAGGRLQHHPSRAGLTQATKAGPVWSGEVRFNEAELAKPLRWTRPRRIFVCAHGDLFHENVPDAWIDQVFAVMALSPQHTFQVLTKRSARMRAYLADPATPHRIGLAAVNTDLHHPTKSALRAPSGVPAAWPLPNIWLGISAEDQARADDRIPQLLATPAAKRFVSLEPLLGPINLVSALGGTRWIGGQRGCGGTHRGRGTPECPREPHHHHDEHCGPGLDSVIVGGESGPRPMHPDWARKIRDACDAAGVPFLFKQWGSTSPAPDHAERIVEAGGSGEPYVAWPDGTISMGRAEDHGGPGMALHRVGKAAAGRLLDGVEHNGGPW